MEDIQINLLLVDELSHVVIFLTKQRNPKIKEGMSETQRLSFNIAKMSFSIKKYLHHQSSMLMLGGVASVDDLDEADRQRHEKNEKNTWICFLSGLVRKCLSDNGAKYGTFCFDFQIFFPSFLLCSFARCGGSGQRNCERICHVMKSRTFLSERFRRVCVQFLIITTQMFFFPVGSRR